MSEVSKQDQNIYIGQFENSNPLHNIEHTDIGIMAFGTIGGSNGQKVFPRICGINFIQSKRASKKIRKVRNNFSGFTPCGIQYPAGVDRYLVLLESLLPEASRLL